MGAEHFDFDFCFIADWSEFKSGKEFFAQKSRPVVGKLADLLLVWTSYLRDSCGIIPMVFYVVSCGAASCNPISENPMIFISDAMAEGAAAAPDGEGLPLLFLVDDRP